MTSDEMGKWIVYAFIATIPVSFALFFLSPIIAAGQILKITGVIKFRNDRGCGQFICCGFYISGDNDKLVLTISAKKYCDTRFVVGARVKFDYRRNIFGIIVILEDSVDLAPN